MSELSWIREARKHIGQREVKGSRHNPLILSWLQNLRAWWANDEVPWCGVFTAQCLRIGHRALPKHWYRASDYLNWGTRLDAPCYGCVVVFTRHRFCPGVCLPNPIRSWSRRQICLRWSS